MSEVYRCERCRRPCSLQHVEDAAAIGWLVWDDHTAVCDSCLSESKQPNTFPGVRISAPQTRPVKHPVSDTRHPSHRAWLLEREKEWGS